MPIVSKPFEQVGMDLIGPINPESQEGHRYILTIIDYGTRYPEAVPLKSATSESVSNAMLSVFSRVGLPKKIITDQGK